MMRERVAEAPEVILREPAGTAQRVGGLPGLSHGTSLHAETARRASRPGTGAGEH